MLDEQTATTAVAESTPAAQGGNHEIDKVRQQVQQKAANLERRNTALEDRILDLEADLDARPITEQSSEADPASVPMETTPVDQELSNLQSDVKFLTDERDWNTTLDRLDNEFGGQHRTAAINNARQEFISRDGMTLTGNDYPSQDKLVAEVREQYLRASLSPNTGPPVGQHSSDSGHSGSNRADLGSEVKSGSFDEVHEQMIARRLNE